MPMLVVGSNRGSYRKTNPQLSQTVESLKIICKSLNQSKQHWWLSPSTIQSIQKMKSARMEEQSQKDLLDGAQGEYDDNDDDDSSAVRRRRRNGGEANGNDDDDEEMIDLQAAEADRSCLLTEDTDGMISEDESVGLS